MKVVALVSGGKDSCYAMLTCQHYNHEIVALANLLPPQDSTDDLDSYMFQTVGHQLIAAYADCMSLPLYRKRITGGSTNQALVYHDTPNDEVEDLYTLLSYIKTQIPDIQAVCSGAIASDYQRTRVERVCARLNLVSLAYLWREPQATLLKQMIEVGIEAILIKVAAAGLIPRQHLGASLETMQPTLYKLRSQFGCNVCGEGGEYETLTLDCPLFTRGRIVLDEWDVVVDGEEESMAAVGLLHPTRFHIEPKTSTSSGGNGDDGDGGGSNVASSTGTVISVSDDFVPPSPNTTTSTTTIQQPQEEESTATGTTTALQQSSVRVKTTQGQQYTTIAAEVLKDQNTDNNNYTTGAETEAAVIAALSSISDQLPGLDLQWSDSVFVHLYVPSMACFAAANAAYAKFLPAVNPPARATVQLAENREVALVAEVVFARDSELEKKKVLHVQSISKWAPSCIGPYSQSVRHRNLVQFAGQIPLDPAVMVINESTVEGQTQLCCQHLQSVAVAMGVDFLNTLAWCTVYTADAAGVAGTRTAQHELRGFLCSNSVLYSHSKRRHTTSSTYNSYNSSNGDITSSSATSSDQEEEQEEEEEEWIDEYLRVPKSVFMVASKHYTYITVPELPRGALVEIQPVTFVDTPKPTSNTSTTSSSDSDNDDDKNVIAKEEEKRYDSVLGEPTPWLNCHRLLLRNGLPGNWAIDIYAQNIMRQTLRIQAWLHTDRNPDQYTPNTAQINNQNRNNELQEALAQCFDGVKRKLVLDGFENADILSAKLYLPTCSHSLLNANTVVDINNNGGLKLVVVPVTRVAPRTAEMAVDFLIEVVAAQ